MYNLAKRNSNIPSLFDDMFSDFAFPSFSNFSSSFNSILKTDIKEEDSKYIYTVEVPGSKKEDINLNIQNGNLCISVKRESEKCEKEEKNNYVRKERYEGVSERSFYIGDNITTEDIKAKYEDGILTIEVPKKEEIAESKKIMIE